MQSSGNILKLATNTMEFNVTAIAASLQPNFKLIYIPWRCCIKGHKIVVSTSKTKELPH